MRQGIDIVINSEYDDLGYNQQNFGGLAKAHSLDHLDPDCYISNRYIHKNYSLLEFPENQETYRQIFSSLDSSIAKPHRKHSRNKQNQAISKEDKILKTLRKK